jgi:hypothetical protein
MTAAGAKALCACEEATNDMGADSKANNISRQKIGSFYIVSYPPRALPSGREFLNSDEVCRGSGSVIMAPPTRFQRGFRNYAVRPKFLVSKRLGRRPHDIEYYLDYWLVSDLARQFLDAISQTDFIYLPVDTEVDAGSEPAASKRLTFPNGRKGPVTPGNACLASTPAPGSSSRCADRTKRGAATASSRRPDGQRSGRARG